MRAGTYAALVLILALLCMPAWALGEETNANANAELDAELEALLAGEEEIPLYQFPDIAPEFRVSAGYRSITQSGEESAIRYECLDCRFMLGLEARAFSYPHRVYFILDAMGDKDYFGEFRYAWGSGIFLRVMNRSLYHNLEHATLVDLNTATADPGVDVRDPGEDYGVQGQLNSVFLRLKAPNYPAHLFASVWEFHRHGTEQHRNLQGSGWHNDIVRTSREREISMDTLINEVGANAHVSPLEFEYVHRQKRFTPEDDTELRDAYTSAGALRAAGIYEHDTIAETEGSSNTLKFHTSYTGKWVGSATFSARERENKDGGAKSDSFIGSAALRWMPATNLSFVARYFHMNNNVDNPSRVRVADSTGTNVYTFDVKDSISSRSDKVSLTARYRPVRKVSLKGQYTHERISRENADDWSIQDETKKSAVLLSAAVTLPGRLKAKADYGYRHIEDPAYNLEPDNSHSGKLTVSWTPVMGIHTYAAYDAIYEKRQYLEYSDSQDAENRRHHRTRLILGGVFASETGVTFNISYARILNHIEQDMVVYEGAIATVNEDVKYMDESDSYSVGADYHYKSQVALHADVTHTRSMGGYEGGAGTLEDTEDYSRMDFQETVFVASADYTFNAGAEAGVEYKYIERYDAEDNPHDKLQNGDAQIVMLRLAKKW